MPGHIAKRENAAILIIGDSGTHKTKLAGDFPSPYFFDFDLGMAIVQATHPGFKDFDSFRDWDREKSAKASPPKFLAQSGYYKYGQAWPQFLLKYNEHEAAVEKGTSPHKTWVFDSLTTMGYVAMAHVLTTGGDPLPHIGSWGAQQEYLRKIILGIMAWPGYKIFIAHMQRSENDLTKITEKLPLITGKLAGGIGSLMDEVWYSNWKDSGAKRKYYVLTEPDSSMRQAKTRWNIPNETEMSWEALSKYLVTPATQSSPAAA